MKLSMGLVLHLLAVTPALLAVSALVSISPQTLALTAALSVLGIAFNSATN
jgi:hypothetical protein